MLTMIMLRFCSECLTLLPSHLAWWWHQKSQRIAKLSRICPLEIMNVRTKSLGNPSNMSQNISVWTKVAEHMTWHCRHQSPALKITVFLLFYSRCSHRHEHVCSFYMFIFLAPLADWLTLCTNLYERTNSERCVCICVQAEHIGIHKVC